MDWEQVTEQLKAPLDPKAIKPPPQGKYGEYVDGLHVIREANRIFGHDGWSYTVERLERTHYDVVELKGRDGPYTQLRTSYLCAVRVNVDGVIREGLAVGVGNGKPENAGDVIESAVKEAETDALKRALRSFGNTFGLALYDKDKSAREVAAPFDAADNRNRMKAAINAKATPQDLDALWKHATFTETFSKLPEPMQNELTTAYTNRMGEISNQPNEEKDAA
ncbi:RAD52 family DNA repair protein [Sulfitobacter sp. 20_GPM-1509m]|uniref:RAD52 family DNA repair protein n=1 Tax=Sulfitobacter sp. 20_GPM-1509m TaxID=1380367 RepID=UPI000688DBAF|nr:RAD52 family DNA repair protein [Sulfitobacter sp. 20_GPM-1509m]